jgi:exopolysaccharide production protein ExoZ
MKTFYSLQYLRALAALAVVAFHTTLTGRVGQAGVDVFFVVSGFIMWTVSEREAAPLQFLARRFIRIWPLYAVATVVMGLHNHVNLSDLTRSLLFIPYRDASGHIWPVLVQGWTLNYEVLFYLLVAATLLSPRRLMAAALTGILAALVAAGLLWRPASALASSYTSPLLLEFVAGVWLGRLVTSGWRPNPILGAGLVVFGLIALAASNMIATDDAYRVLVWGIPSAALVTGLLAVELAGWAPKVAPLRILGDASYSIYLFHPFLLKTVQAALSRLPAALTVIGVVAAAGVAGVLIYWFVERRVTEGLKRMIGPMFEPKAPAPVDA